MPLVTTLPPELQKIHIMGIGGTAMAALAGMLVDAGYTVSGSDGNRIYPPMSDYLAQLGITPMEGYLARNLEFGPDLVVVGNAVRPDNPDTLGWIDTEGGSLQYHLGAVALGNGLKVDHGRRILVLSSSRIREMTPREIV